MVQFQRNKPSSTTTSHSCRVTYLVGGLILLALVIHKPLRKPVEDYAGVSINFKTPSVLRPDEDDLKRQQIAQEFQAGFKNLDNDDDSFEGEAGVGDDEKDSHDAVLKELEPPERTLLRDYQFYHSNQNLEDLLEDFQKRTNSHSHESILNAVKEGWCPELADKSFLVVSLDCKSSAKSLLQDFLYAIAWAIVMDRTLLWRDFQQECMEVRRRDRKQNCQSTCEGIATLQDWIPSYDKWNYHLSFPPIVTVQSMEDIDSAEVHKSKVIRLPPGNISPLTSRYLQTLSPRRTAAKLLESPFLYGMLLDETLTVDPKQLSGTQTLPSNVHSYVVQSTSQNRDTKKKAKATKKAKKDKRINNKNSLEAKECFQRILFTPCVIYHVGDPSLLPSWSLSKGDHNGPVCDIQPVSNTMPSPTLAMVAMGGRHAHDGVLWLEDDQPSPLFTLMTQLRSYHGRLEDAHFQLPLCTSFHSSSTKPLASNDR